RENSQNSSCIKSGEVVVRLASIEQNAGDEKPRQRKEKIDAGPPKVKHRLHESYCNVGIRNHNTEMNEHHEDDRQASDSIESADTAKTCDLHRHCAANFTTPQPLSCARF